MDWLQLENDAKDSGYCAVCGVDEAGRGPLAGPVFAAAVIFPQGKMIEGINDSKKLSPRKREKLFDIIKEEAVSFSIASVDEKTIDRINILQATHLAMQKAINGLEIQADMALIDGNNLPKLDIPAKSIVKGDTLSLSIAAASILAKVSRDRFMIKMSEKFPEYCFEKHKGYGTKLHYEMLKKFGPSDIHRMSFIKKIVSKQTL